MDQMKRFMDQNISWLTVYTNLEIKDRVFLKFLARFIFGHF